MLTIQAAREEKKSPAFYTFKRVSAIGKESRARFFKRNQKASLDYFLMNLKSLPMKRAAEPNSSSIRNNWLYFAILSEREAEPVLI